MKDQDQAGANQGPDRADQPVRDQRTGRFKPDRSANPAGRPKGVPPLATVKTIHLRDHIIEAARRAGMDIDPNAADGLTVYLHSIAKTDVKGDGRPPSESAPEFARQGAYAAH